MLWDYHSAFRKWMTAEPKQAQLLKEFECEFTREASDMLASAS